MDRASEGPRFNQAGCGRWTASAAAAFVPTTESMQAPTSEQWHGRTKVSQVNEVIAL